MSSKPIFPAEIAEFTVENHFTVYSKSTVAIYLSIIFTLILVVCLLPFIHVSISVNSVGILRPSSKIAQIKSNANGILSQQHIAENQIVKSGQILFVIGSPVLEEKKKFYQLRIDENKKFIYDLSILLSGTLLTDGHLQTSFYSQALKSFQQKLDESRTRYLKFKIDFERNKKLYDEKVIATTDYEDFKFRYDNATHELEVIKQTQLGNWQNELKNLNKELAEYTSQIEQIDKDGEALIVKAPVSGTIQNMAGVYLGSTIFSSQDLAQISPDTTLIAEVYVNTADIGLLRADMEVRFKVDAFDYNQWGFINGRVIDISNDVHIREGKHFFEVRCSLDKDYLSLKNGYRGKLKKGMSIQANFLVTERTIWQLLYDKADDWLNPNSINQSNFK
jgi:HlyD family secretion protein